MQNEERLKLLIQLWQAENPIKTSKIQTFFVVQSILVMSLNSSSAMGWVAPLIGIGFSFAWLFSIGRTLAFQKFWKDCPWPRTLVTDEYQKGEWENDDDVISFGTDHGYAGNLLRALQKIGDEQVLLIMEDMFINEKVETNFIKRMAGLMKEQTQYYGMFRLYPCPGSDLDIPTTADYGGISREARYRVSCMASMWQVDVLKKILPHVNTPWEFELKGTELSRDFHQAFFAVRRDRKTWPLNHFATAITRGVWEQSALDFCKKNGIEVNPLKR